MKPELLALLPEDMTLRQARKLLNSKTPADFVEAFNGELKDMTWRDFMDIAKVVSEEQRKALQEALEGEPTPRQRATRRRRNPPTLWAARFKKLRKGLTAKEVADQFGVKTNSIYILAKRHGYKLKAAK